MLPNRAKPEACRSGPEASHGTRPQVVLAVFLVVSASVGLVFLIGPGERPHGPLSDTTVSVAAGVQAQEAGAAATPVVVEPAVREAAVGPATEGWLKAPVIHSMEERWGLQVTSVRMAMRGAGLDLRYKVLDPSKATHLLHLKQAAYLVEQESGKMIPVPFQRENQTSQKLVAGKTYFTLLSNKGQLVKPGTKVTLVIDTGRQSDIAVE